MRKKNNSTYQLLNDYQFSKGTLDSLEHNRNITLLTIDRLCQILQVDIDEVVHITLEPPPEKLECKQ